MPEGDAQNEVGSTDPDRVELTPGLVELSGRFAISPGARAPCLCLVRGFLEVVVRGPGAGTFAWREHGSAAPARAATAGVVEIVEIEVK